MKLPRLYAIADAAVLAAKNVPVEEFATALRLAGVSLVQYRAKDATPQAVLRNAASISEVFAGSGAVLIMNDRSDLAVLARWDGVHVGQEDLSPQDAKVVFAGARVTTLREEQERDGWGTQFLAGREIPHLRSEMWGTQFRDPPREPTHAIRPHGRGARSGGTPASDSGVVGVSTHNEAQVIVADAGMADYVAIGPVFATGTKLDAAAVVGLEGVRRARALTSKPLVAIGGMTRENARSVIDAGADAVAVISGLFVEGETVEKVARDFLRILG